MWNRIGLAAADFVLPDIAGGTGRLEQYRGSWLLLVFHRHLG